MAVSAMLPEALLSALSAIPPDLFIALLPVTLAGLLRLFEA